MRKKPQPSPEGLALIMSLAAQQFPSTCPVCHQVVKDIKLRGSQLYRLPCGHRVNI